MLEIQFFVVTTAFRKTGLFQMGPRNWNTQQSDPKEVWGSSKNQWMVANAFSRLTFLGHTWRSSSHRLFQNLYNLKESVAVWQSHLKLKAPTAVTKAYTLNEASRGAKITTTRHLKRPTQRVKERSLLTVFHEKLTQGPSHNALSQPPGPFLDIHVTLLAVLQMKKRLVKYELEPRNL